MRKTLAVLFLATVLVSCGGGSAEAPTAACDTCEVACDTCKVAVDSIAPAVDSVVLEK